MPKRERETRHKYYEKKKIEKRMLQLQRTYRQNEKIQRALGSPDVPFPSSWVRCSAVYQLKKSLQSKSLLSSFSALFCCLGEKNNLEQLKKQGVAYSSPTESTMKHGTSHLPPEKQTEKSPAAWNQSGTKKLWKANGFCLTLQPKLSENTMQALVTLPRHKFSHRWQTKQYQALMHDASNG